MTYTFNDWIKEEKKAIKNRCSCSVEKAKLRNKDIDLDSCPCKNHTLIMGHCIVCGAKEELNTFGF